MATSLSANYVLQSSDDPPAYIIVKAQGWLTGAKDVLEKLNDPAHADTINPTSYKYRLNLSMESGDERYAFVNTVMWVGSGCRRGHEGALPAIYLFYFLRMKLTSCQFKKQSFLTRSASINLAVFCRRKYYDSLATFYYCYESIQTTSSFIFLLLSCLFILMSLA